MKVKELIDKYEAAECVVDFVSGKTLLKNIRRDLEQLDEPEKVKVPQVVADWIERSKQEKRNLRNTLNNGGEKMRLWFLDQENYDLFARAWLDGYEVEEEKRYLVKIKAKTLLCKRWKWENIFFSSIQRPFYKKRTRRSWVRLGARLPRN